MNLNNIPHELKILDQWVCTKGDSKLPMIPYTSDCASSVNPLTWSAFQQAVSSIDCGNYDYVGFVFNNNGIVGIDIDDVYDDDGFLSELAVDIIGKCKSYTEKSKSGTGFHILVKGDIPFTGRNNLKGVEMYKQSRFFIMTGDVILYDNIIENQEAIDYIVQKYFPNTRTNENDTPYEDRIYNPIWEKAESGRIKLRPVYPRIPNGCRNICLTSLAGMLHNQGYSAKHIYDELIYCNKVACEPMLHQNEIRTIVNSVTKYKR